VSLFRFALRRIRHDYEIAGKFGVEWTDGSFIIELSNGATPNTSPDIFCCVGIGTQALLFRIGGIWKIWVEMEMEREMETVM